MTKAKTRMDFEGLQDELSHFEDQHDIIIFSARDIGSRAREMDGPDSDRDIMFLFDQPAIAYKRNRGTIDTIQEHNRFEVDYSGWNIQKFADLLADSNPTTIEYLLSPIIYHETDAATAELRYLEQHARRNFSPIALYYHYRSMAEDNYEKYIANPERSTYEPTANRHLKCARGLLYAREIRKTGLLPDMDFIHFIENANTVTTSELETLYEWLDMKLNGDSDEYDRRIPFQEQYSHEFDLEPGDEDFPDGGINTNLTEHFIEKMDMHNFSNYEHA